jgi:hypothetical protein
MLKHNLPTVEGDPLHALAPEGQVIIAQRFIAGTTWANDTRVPEGRLNRGTRARFQASLRDAP